MYPLPEITSPVGMTAALASARDRAKYEMMEVECMLVIGYGFGSCTI